MGGEGGRIFLSQFFSLFFRSTGSLIHRACALREIISLFPSPLSRGMYGQCGIYRRSNIFLALDIIIMLKLKICIGQLFAVEIELMITSVCGWQRTPGPIKCTWNLETYPIVIYYCEYRDNNLLLSIKNTD